MKCKNCKHLEYKDGGRERYAWCPFIGDNPDLEFERYCGAFKKMSNADRIRNMTDEELAIIIMCPNDIGNCDADCDKDAEITCQKCSLEWLQKEVE